MLTLFIMMSRPDFFNLTICTIGVFMMFNTDRITKLRFKLLVVGILITIIYDLIWFFMNHFEYSEEPKADASGEINVRRFSLMMSYASFILRVRLFHQLNNII